MTAAVLTRAPFVPLEVEERWDKSLLEEAHALLSYKPKAIREADQIRKRGLDGVILARALDKLEIEPFTLKSVQAYKDYMLKEARKNDAFSITKFMHTANRHHTDGSDTVKLVGYPAWLSTIITTTICAIGHWAGYNAGWGWDGHKSVIITGHMSALTAQHVMTIPLMLMGAWSFLMYLRHKKAISTTAYWNPTAVQNYDGAIPAFALQRMVSLRKELGSDVTFHVEELNVQKQELETEEYLPPPAPDPFLVCTFRGISCYIDVWDEPQFEGRRTV